MGGSETGFGHVARMMPIHDSFVTNGIDARFIINGDNAIHGLLEQRKYDLVDWTDSGFNTEFVNDTDCVLVDVLSYPLPFINSIKKHTDKVFFISDEFDTDQLPSKVINWRVNAQVNLKVQNGLYGEEFVPLRAQIKNLKVKVLDGEKTNIFVSMGSGDVINLIPKILDAFAFKLKEKVTFKVVIRSYHSNYHQLLNDYGDFVDFLVDAPATKLFEEMAVCHCAIASGGHSIYEFAYLGIPVIHVLLVDNQKPATAWNNTGFTFPIGWYNPDNFTNKVQDGIRFFSNIENREKASNIGKNLIDGNGSDRIFKYLAS